MDIVVKIVSFIIIFVVVIYLNAQRKKHESERQENITLLIKQEIARKENDRFTRRLNDLANHYIYKENHSQQVKIIANTTKPVIVLCSDNIHATYQELALEDLVVPVIALLYYMGKTNYYTLIYNIEGGFTPNGMQKLAEALGKELHFHHISRGKAIEVLPFAITKP